MSERDSFEAEGWAKLAQLRAAGWSVAVHNDYRLKGRSFTFWLFTHADGRWIKGEGVTDAEALAVAYAAFYDSARPAAPPPAGHWGTPGEACNRGAPDCMVSHSCAPGQETHLLRNAPSPPGSAVAGAPLRKESWLRQLLIALAPMTIPEMDLFADGLQANLISHGWLAPAAPPGSAVAGARSMAAERDDGGGWCRFCVGKPHRATEPCPAPAAPPGSAAKGPINER